MPCGPEDDDSDWKGGSKGQRLKTTGLLQLTRLFMPHFAGLGKVPFGLA